MSILKKHNLINENICLDFKIPSILLQLFEEAEHFDSINSEEYFCVADAIDVQCKNLVTLGKMSQNQWDLICQKYPMG